MQFQNARLSLGIDIGSTTVKYALVNDKREIIASRYERHKSAVVSTLKELLSDLIQKEDCGSASVRLTGSGALVLAQTAKIGFVQEVVAAGTSRANFTNRLKLFMAQARANAADQLSKGDEQ